MKKIIIGLVLILALLYFSKMMKEGLEGNKTSEIPVGTMVVEKGYVYQRTPSGYLLIGRIGNSRCRSYVPSQLYGNYESDTLDSFPTDNVGSCGKEVMHKFPSERIAGIVFDKKTKMCFAKSKMDPSKFKSSVDHIAMFKNPCFHSTPALR